MSVAPSKSTAKLNVIDQASKGQTGKGKGKGKGKGRGAGAAGKDVSEEDKAKYNTFKATILCRHCGAKGHYTDWCFDKIKQERKALRDKVVKGEVSGNASSSKPNLPTQPSPSQPKPATNPPEQFQSESEGQQGKKRKLFLNRALKAVEKAGYKVEELQSNDKSD